MPTKNFPWYVSENISVTNEVEGTDTKPAFNWLHLDVLVDGDVIIEGDPRSEGEA